MQNIIVSWKKEERKEREEMLREKEGEIHSAISTDHCKNKSAVALKSITSVPLCLLC